MKKKLNMVQTGNAMVDKHWGGFYRGGTYLLIGPRKSGRTLLGLQYTLEGVNNKEVTLYFTSMRPKDLMIHAASIDFDLQTAMNQNKVIVVRVSPPSEEYDAHNPDSYLVEYINDIVTVVEQYQPDRLVFDELTPFIGFENPGLLQQTFLQALENIEEKNVTSFFILAEPATALAQNLVDSVAQYSTAIIYLQKFSEEDAVSHTGRLTITPNIGHTEGQFTAPYYIKPYKGIDFELDDNQGMDAPLHTVEQPPVSGQFTGQVPPPSRNTSSKYKPLTNVEVQAPSAAQPVNSLYEISEFKLILNNQIALYKSTGQAFTLISLKLDAIAEQQRLLSFPQLIQAVRLATDKKDKLCNMNGMLLVLMGKGEDKTLNALVNRMKAFFPSQDSGYLNTVTNYIYAFQFEVNDKIQNAESVLHELMDEEA